MMYFKINLKEDPLLEDTFYEIKIRDGVLSKKIAVSNDEFEESGCIEKMDLDNIENYKVINIMCKPESSKAMVSIVTKDQEGKTILVRREGTIEFV